MNVGTCLILAAGKGTRMGPIGERVPKVLWPIFERTLLELQISYAISLGCTHLYINTHFLHKDIENFLSSYECLPDMTLLYEKELLDVGGAVCNVGLQKEMQEKREDNEALLILSGDQFFFFDPMFMQKAVDLLRENNAVLFGMNVDSFSSYNETVLNSNNKLTDIILASERKKDTPYVSYSGMGLINMHKLKIKAGPSSFFETAANYKSGSVNVVIPDFYAYWDFGTLERYIKSMRELFLKLNTKEEGPDLDFFKNALVLDPLKVNLERSSYNSTRHNTFKLSEFYLSTENVLKFNKNEKT